MPRNRNSRRQTAYLGVQAATPPNLQVHDRAPTTNDSIGYRIGALWIFQTTPEEIWMLVDLSAGVATWVQLYPGAGGGASSFPCDVGVANEAGGVVNVFGDGVAITTSGAGNTITISPTGALATTYTADVGSATPSLGNLNVFGGELINSAGAGDTLTINLDRGLNGQVPIAATGAPTLYANITSTGGTITVSNGPNTINLETVGGAGDIKTLTGNTGGAVPPDAGGDLDVLGDTATGITVTGNPGAFTLTISNTNNSIVTVQTVDATPTALFTQAVSAGQAIDVEAYIIAAKSDYTAAIGGNLNGVARREAAGVTTLVGSPQLSWSEDSAGTPSFDFVISGNNVLIQVTGEAATTYNWKAFVTIVTV